METQNTTEIETTVHARHLIRRDDLIAALAQLIRREEESIPCEEIYKVLAPFLPADARLPGAAVDALDEVLAKNKI